MSAGTWPIHHAPDRTALLVFLRAPEPGRVKTRLAARIGADEAARVYEELVAITLAAVASCSPCDPVLLYTPSDAGDDIRGWLGHGLAICPQADGDLGHRLGTAFGSAFAAGAERVIAVGTDAPDLSATLLEEAAERLMQFELVIGPATDGGYWLIGLSRPCAAVFEGIPWSSADTAAATLTAARRAGLRTSALPLLPDVDTAADLESWRARGSN